MGSAHPTTGQTWLISCRHTAITIRIIKVPLLPSIREAEAIAKLSEAIRDPRPTGEGKTVWGRTRGAARGARRGEKVARDARGGARLGPLFRRGLPRRAPRAARRAARPGPAVILIILIILVIILIAFHPCTNKVQARTKAPLNTGTGQKSA